MWLFPSESTAKLQRNRKSLPFLARISRAQISIAFEKILWQQSWIIIWFDIGLNQLLIAFKNVWHILGTQILVDMTVVYLSYMVGKSTNGI